MTRVTLREVISEDLPVFFEHQRDPQAVQMADFPSRDLPTFMAHWEKILADPDSILRTILVDGVPAGNLVSWSIENMRQVGYWLGREYWGRGIATRALRIFLSQVPFRPLFAEVAAHNLGSRRVLERCGFQKVGDTLVVSSEHPFGELTEWMFILEAGDEIGLEYDNEAFPGRTVAWDTGRGALRLIDQRLLPGEFRIVELFDVQETADAIRNMVVRGAPAIGATAAFGLALAAQRSQAGALAGLLADLQAAGDLLLASRPTAVNLRWAVERLLTDARRFDGSPDNLRAAVLAGAQRLADEDVAINRRMAAHGAALLADGDVVIHHCNTGALAAVDWGTALGVIRMAHEQGKRLHVLVDETRPRLQGARLTAWELQQYGIPYEIITDNAGGFFLRSGEVKKVLFGADRVAANGDLANKIGTYMLALAAHDNRVPAYGVVPTSTIDLSLPDGAHIPIELRTAAEVLNLQIDGQPVAPHSAGARNPAFDVTPHRLLAAIVTENGVVYPPYGPGLAQAVAGQD